MVKQTFLLGVFHILFLVNKDLTSVHKHLLISLIQGYGYCIFANKKMNVSEMDVSHMDSWVVCGKGQE